MGIARSHQNLQDRITQQWVILFGRKIYPKVHDWLLGPFGNTNGIGLKFIEQLAENEQLIIDRNSKNIGLIQSIHQLNLSKEDLQTLSKEVVDFYENTGNYDFELSVKWNPFFKIFGVLLKFLFSKRIQQLNIPLNNKTKSSEIKSEIISLRDSKTHEIKRIIWLRSNPDTEEVIYSGIYETCIIPSGQSCIKAIFPLPNGNATVILTPHVVANGALTLKSSGKKFGDSGFYFLLKDVKDNLWAKFVPSFEDMLIVSSMHNGKIYAEQQLTIWTFNVLKFEYTIQKKPS